MKQTKPERAHNVLDRWLQSSGLEQPLNEHRLLLNWDSIMGEMIGKRTVDKYIVNKVLYVRLSSSILRLEMSQNKNFYINMLNRNIAGNEKQVITNIIFL